MEFLSRGLASAAGDPWSFSSMFAKDPDTRPDIFWSGGPPGARIAESCPLLVLISDSGCKALASCWCSYGPWATLSLVASSLKD